VALFAGACRSGDAHQPGDASPSSGAAASQPAASPSPSATPTADAYANPPSDASTVVAALTAALAGATQPCPARLQSDWHAICVATDLDGDGKPDAAYFLPLTGTTPTAAHPGAVVVRRGATGAFEQFTLEAPVDASPIGRLFFNVSERSGDATPDVAFITTACAGPTCTTHAHVEKWDGTAWRDIGPSDAGVANVDAMSFEGSGASSRITVHGGVVTSPGAGPTRAATTTYHLSGGRYVVDSVKFEPPVYLYQAIVDADALFANGDFARAVAAYHTAIESPSLKDWKKDDGQAPGRPFLEGYALFRIAVATAAQGQDANPALDAAIAGSQDAIFAYAAERFRSGYQETSSVHAGCLAATTYLSLVTPDGDNPAHIKDGFFYGHANPMRTSADICPL
jgi:hypothetical protein